MGVACYWKQRRTQASYFYCSPLYAPIVTTENAIVTHQLCVQELSPPLLAANNTERASRQEVVQWRD